MIRRYSGDAARYLVLKAITGFPSRSTQGLVTHPDTVQSSAGSVADLSTAMGMAVLRASSYGDGVAVIVGQNASVQATQAGLTLTEALRLDSTSTQLHLLPAMRGVLVMPINSVMIHVQEWLQTNWRWQPVSAISDESTWLRIWNEGFMQETIFSMLFGGISNALGTTYITVP
jgi:hypothetical protein